MTPPPKAVDLLIIGTGAGGMAAALSGAVLGLDVLVVEKTHQIGGTTARSAGSVWLPNSRHSAPGSDTFEQAMDYLRNAVGNRLDEPIAAAFLRAAPEMVDLFEKNTSVKLRAYPYHPDYLAGLEGATLSGRVLEPMPFDGSVLGRNFAHIRPPLAEFTLFGKMMVDRVDIGHLMAASGRLSSFCHAIALFARYGVDRLRYKRGTRLVMGNALVGRLYHSLLARRVPVIRSTEVIALHQTEGRVSGAEMVWQGERVAVEARAGVVLATGGVSNHPKIRKSHMPDTLFATSLVVDSVTGDGLELAEDVGGHLGPHHESNGFWAPVSSRTRADGSIAVFPHFVLDRGKPGVLAVDPSGNRFVNEATTYHLFGLALMARHKQFPEGGCYLICDDAFMEKYGLGMIRPKRMGLSAALRDGYVVAGQTTSQLAEKINLPGEALAKSIDRHNGFAITGVDEDFAKGQDAYQRNLGDPAQRPNPCIGVVRQPPFYGLQIFPGDIGASVGLSTDACARVLDKNLEPVDGLYACGNDMASLMAGRYPGPGITLGPAMTFGFIAARHALALKRKCNLHVTDQG